MSGLSDRIRAVCAKHYGHVGSGCDRCPLRRPCLDFGHAPAHTFAQLDEARAEFNAAAEVTA